MAGKSGGEVEYILRADDSKVESDIEKANKKVEKAAKKSADESLKIEEQKTKDLKQESDKVVKNAEKAAADMAEAWEDSAQDAKQSLGKLDNESVEVKVDTDTDTSEAEQKLKAVSKDKNVDIKGKADMSSAKQEIEDLGETAEDVAEKISESLGGGDDSASALGNIVGALKSSFSDAASSAVPLVGEISNLTTGLSGAQAAAIGAGAAFVGISVAGVNSAMDIDSAMNQLTASTGATAEESEKFRQVMENVYKNNYGDSFGDIGDAIADVKKNLGDLDEASLQNVTESAFALRDTFGYEISESTRAAKAMMDNFGISGDEAMNLIAAGAQNGLDYSGELLDSISEYSVQFGKVGLDANDMFSIFQKGADSGAFNLDKVGDAVKEMSIRVVDGSDTTREGFELLGLNADEMAQKFATGGETAKGAFEETLSALAAMEDPIAQNTAGVDLMGTMWEDLGPEAVKALADIEDGAYSTSDAMEGIKDVKYDDLASQFEELKRNAEMLLVPLGEALIPLLSELSTAVLPILAECIGPLISMFTELLTPIVGLISSAITPLIDALVSLVSMAITPLVAAVQTVLVPLFTGALNSIFSTATSVIGNITNIFRNLIDFVKNVFTGNWKGAWENIKNIFSNAVSGLASIFKAPINAIVDGWNSLASSIGSISIPDWVPGVGGNSYSLPKMSRLKVGLDYVPSDMFPAYLDEGEWVLTKEEANLLRSLGGIERLASLSDQTLNSNPVNITVDGGKGLDYDKLGDAVVRALIRANVAFKCDDRTFAQLIGDVKDYV